MTSPRLICAAIVLGAAAGCATTPAGSQKENPGPTYSATPEETARLAVKDAIQDDSVTLYVNGMGCPLCASDVDAQLKRLPGVKSLDINLADGKVGIELWPKARHPSPADLAAAVDDAGFTLVKIGKE